MTEQTRELKYFTPIAGLFIAVLLISNTVAGKFFSIGSVSFPSGVILFPAPGGCEAFRVSLLKCNPRFVALRAAGIRNTTYGMIGMIRSDGRIGTGQPRGRCLTGNRHHRLFA
jgi:hypothetical protein